MDNRRAAFHAHVHLLPAHLTPAKIIVCRITILPRNYWRGLYCLFFHRAQELADLDRLTGSDGPVLVLVYGRRRVGKTWLLQY